MGRHSRYDDREREDMDKWPLGHELSRSPDPAPTYCSIVRHALPGDRWQARVMEHTATTQRLKFTTAPCHTWARAKCLAMDYAEDCGYTIAYSD